MLPVYCILACCVPSAQFYQNPAQTCRNLDRLCVKSLSRLENPRTCDPQIQDVLWYNATLLWKIVSLNGMTPQSAKVRFTLSKKNYKANNSAPNMLRSGQFFAQLETSESWKSCQISIMGHWACFTMANGRFIHDFTFHVDLQHPKAIRKKQTPTFKTVIFWYFSDDSTFPNSSNNTWTIILKNIQKSNPSTSEPASFGGSINSAFSFLIPDLGWWIFSPLTCWTTTSNIPSHRVKGTTPAL